MITKDSKKVERYGKTVSKGSFYRTLTQAKTNMKKSIVTIFTLVSLEIIDAKTIDKMLQITNILQTGLIGLNEPVIQKIVEILENF